jgi:hypothetical protein
MAIVIFHNLFFQFGAKWYENKEKEALPLRYALLLILRLNLQKS